MTKESYRKAFLNAKADYEQSVMRRNQLQDEIAALDKDIVTLRRGVTVLAAMCGEDIDEMTLGLTESLRALFTEATAALTIEDVTKGISDLGFDLNSQKNPSASIMAVLARLTEAKEITNEKRRIRRSDGTMKLKNYWFGKNVAAKA